MIALPSQLPLLRVGEIELAQYEHAWIAQTIRAAAERAGHADWWIADDIARGVLAYLKNRCAQSAITLEELEAKLRRTLTAIGFADIAAEIRAEPPMVELNLQDVARKAGGVELAFFQLLEARVRELHATGIRSVALSGVREAVLILHAAKNYSHRCRKLEDDIVIFLRRRLSRNDSIPCEIQLAAA